MKTSSQFKAFLKSFTPYQIGYLTVVLLLTIGFTIMITEIAIGRKTNRSPIGAFCMLGKKYKFIGILATVVAAIIVPYYCVITGWVAKYFSGYLTGQHAAMAEETYFTNFIAQPVEPLIWLFVVVLLASAVVFRGVRKGIEKASRILMPVLLALSVVVAIYSVTLPGAMEGVKYFLIPNFSNFTFDTVIQSLGQMFYSLSLAMGIMITYGSYLGKEENIESAVRRIEFFDTAVALLAGFMIIPAVFAFSGGDAQALNAGPGLMFQTLPKVFEEMGGHVMLFGGLSMGTVIGCVFFLLVFFAALTSVISLLEAVISTVCDQLKISRKLSVCIVGAGTALIGVLPSLGNGVLSNVSIMGYSILDFMDFITNSLLMPIGALLTCLFIGYVAGAKTVTDEVELSGVFKRKRMYEVMVRYIAPICLLAILVTFGVLPLLQ